MESFVKSLKLIISKEKHEKVFETTKAKIQKETNSFEFEFENVFSLEGDVKFKFYSHKVNDSH